MSPIGRGKPGYAPGIDTHEAANERTSGENPGQLDPRALAVVALDVTGEIRVLRAVLDAVGLDRGIINRLEAVGAVRLGRDRLEFVDESTRHEYVEAIDARQRRGLHRTFASVLVERRHRVARAEHLAASAVGPDELAARASAALGDEATERGDSLLAAGLYLRAGELAPAAEDRARLLLRAGDGFWNAGAYVDARQAFDAAHVGSNDPILRADITLQLGQLTMYQRGPRYARDQFIAGAAAVQRHDVDRAAMLLVHAASTVTLSSDVTGALRLARRASDLAERGTGASTLPAALMLGYLTRQHGDTTEFDELFPMLSSVAEELKDTDVAEADLFLQLVGMLHVYGENWTAGRAYLAAVAHRSGRRSRTATAALATATLAELCWRSGRWDEAWDLATCSLVTDVTLTGARLWLLAFTAHLDAAFGRADDCRARAHASLAESEPMGFGTAILWAYHALGLLELGLGHPVAAAAHLDRVDAIATAHQMRDPSTIWWNADHVEALVRSGRRHEAERAQVRFEAAAAASTSVWAQATSTRCRALLARDEAEHWFGLAIGHHQDLAAPFELARTLLCRAEHRVATGSTLSAQDDLDESIAIFESLGATTWAAHGRALRDSVDNHPPAAPESMLTPAERRVADAVADGLSNREVAATLYVSEKTVEFHLRNIYRKLELRSRTQLVRRLSQS